MYSVIIPTHNRPSTLGRAVRSALAQSLPPGEVLVVDDGSSPRVDAAEFVGGAIPVTVIRRDIPEGAPRARNAGLDRAAHPFVAFLDDDDEWLPQKMERQLDCLRRRPELVAVSCGRFLVSGPTQSLEVFSEQYSRRYFWYDNYFGSFSFLAVRIDERTCGLRMDADFPACQDWAYLAGLSERGPLGVVEEPLCRYYLQHGGPRITSGSSNRTRGLTRFCQQFQQRMPADARRWVEGRIHFLRARDEASLLRRWAHLPLGIALTLRCGLPLKRRLPTVARYTAEALIGFERMERIKHQIRRRWPSRI
jgi:glycosyltransferase involved in cell wall biosynthesis